MYTYLVINIAALLIPFLFSFEKKLGFYKKWKYLFPAIFFSMAVFIPWDILFTEHGVWGFNSRYLTGLKILNLPLEEWLFFITIPYACVFTYEAVKYYVSGDVLKKYSRIFSASLVIMLIFTAIINHDKIYTLITFTSLAVFILFLHFFLRVGYLAKFYLSWFLILPPFFIINGILTGSFIHEPVVWYNNTENLGIRLFTIPVEDLFYGMLLLMLNVAIYEGTAKKYFAGPDRDGVRQR